ALTVSPNSVVLSGPYSEVRLMLDGKFKDDSVRDVSHQAVTELRDPKIAEIDESGILRPRKDGKTTLIARAGGKETVVPIEVCGLAKAAPPRFLSDVMPVLTKAGCNLGACHGAGSGKGGFKLSLLGYDPESDYDALVRGAAIRRISKSAPEQSLILRKPTLA